jgi:hypothetical protein
MLFDLGAQRLDIAAADQGAWDRPPEAYDFAADDIQIDRPGETDSLVKPCINGTCSSVFRPATGSALQGKMDNEGAARRRGQTRYSVAQG